MGDLTKAKYFNLTMEVVVKLVLVLILMMWSFCAFSAKQLCTFDFSKDGASLNWTAFKTPKKVGVKAKFTDFKMMSTPSATFKDLIKTASIDINSQSVETGDKARDAKIMTFFFRKMAKGMNIIGKVLKADAKKAEVEFTMNGVTKKLDMKVALDEKASQLTLSGKMDVLEFGLKESLSAITKACYEKHEGVTWPDVELEFLVKVIKTCK